MITEQYGTTSVREIRISESNVRLMLLENLQERAGTPYDYDYDKPIILKEKDGGYVFRFVQSEVTSDTEAKSINFKPMPKA